MKAVRAYLQAQSLQPSQAVVRLDGQYGNGAIVADLAGLAYAMRGKDYDLLDQELVQACLAQPPDQQTTHPETGTCRALFDFPDLLLSPSRPRTRVIVAARAIPDTPVKVGTIRGEHVCELFYTALPPGAFTPADVVALYPHRGAFETVLSDEDKEQAPDRWCSHTAWGQEFWLILAQWTWNLRLELGHTLHPSPMRTTEFAPARSPESVAKPGGAVQTTAVSRPSARVGSLPHGMSRGRTLHAPARRHRPVPCWFPLISPGASPRTRWQPTGSVCSSIGHCRSCPLREECQGYGTATKRPRRVSTVLWPLDKTEVVASLPPPLHASHPILWGDWQRRFHRREVVKLLRHQRVDVQLAETALSVQPPPVRLLSRAERAHWRLSWAEHLARNARPKAAPNVSIMLYGISDAFATSLGLQIA